MRRLSLLALCATAFACAAPQAGPDLGPAVLRLEISDLQDPVVVGDFASYEVSVKNVGESSTTDLQLKCALDEGLECLVGKGSTVGSEGASSILFAPLAELAPGETAYWRFDVRAEEAGLHHVRAGISGPDQLPTVAGESTRFQDFEYWSKPLGAPFPWTGTR